MLLGGLTTSSASNSNFTYYLGTYLTSSASPTESSVQQVMPVAGTVSNLAISLGSAPGSGNSWTFTIRKNGAATGVTCKVEGSTAKECTSSATVTFAAGDLLSLQATPSGGPNGWSSLRWGATLSQ